MFLIAYGVVVTRKSAAYSEEYEIYCMFLIAYGVVVTRKSAAYSEEY